MVLRRDATAVRKAIATDYGINYRNFDNGINFEWFLGLSDLAKKVIANDLRRQQEANAKTRRDKTK